jgi:hypothetical protein
MAKKHVGRKHKGGKKKSHRGTKIVPEHMLGKSLHHKGGRKKHGGRKKK